MHSTPSHERSITELDQRIIAQFEKAKTALKSSNLQYVVDLCTKWIERYPEVVDFRKLLREAQIKLKYPDGQFGKTANWSAGLMSIIGSNEKDPVKALQKCEKTLAADPLDIRANEILAQTADKLSWRKTHIFAIQTLLTNPKRKPQHVVNLVELLIQEKETEMALRVCETFLKVFPENALILHIRNQASISQSIQKAEA